MIVAQTYSYAVSDYHDAIYHLLVIAAYTVSIVLSVSYIFSANIGIVTFIIQTFDFWYKMYNLMLLIISSYFIIPDYVENTSYYVVASLGSMCGYILSFVMDALSVENKYKNLFIIVVVLWSMYISLSVYFIVDDTSQYWNPFEKYNFKYSRINFKSTFVSSQFNLCLFMFKPIFSQINRKIRRCIGKQISKNTKQGAQDDRSFVQRSYVLYKRPCVHWVHS